MVTVESIVYVNSHSDPCFFCDPRNAGVDRRIQAIATITIAGTFRVSGVQIIQLAPGKLPLVSTTNVGGFMSLEFLDGELKREVETAVLREYLKLIGISDLLTKAPGSGNDQHA